MKFAHIADCHIGGWRDERMKELNMRSFQEACNIILERNVDFMLISGDLFNTSLPPLDKLKETVRELQKLRKANICIYIIAGSHDFSPSGKTMLDVLEEAGLVINVVKGEMVDDKLKLTFTIDEKTGAKITGMVGRKGSLEKAYYENLRREEIESEDGFKIFMFHSAISEFKEKGMENMQASPISLLPKNFDYYAGGHVHIIKKYDIEGYKNIIYPGPLFPNNFSEIEKLKNGGFYIVEDENINYIPIKLKEVESVVMDCRGKSAENVSKELDEALGKLKVNDKIVTIKLKGILSIGKPADINLREKIRELYTKGAYFVMKNTNQLESKQFEQVTVNEKSVEEIERKIIEEHVGQNKSLDLNESLEESFCRRLMEAFSEEKQEGETNADYENKVKLIGKKLIADIKDS